MMIWMNLGYSYRENDNGLKIIVAFKLQFNIIVEVSGLLKLLAGMKVL